MIWINTMRKRYALIKRLEESSNTNTATNKKATCFNTNATARNQEENDDEEREYDQSSCTVEMSNSNKILLNPFVPPLGFAMVAPGIYRSGHPNHCNFSFLDGLQLKSIMYLCVDSYRPHTFNWAQDRGLKIFQYRIDSYKQPNNQSSSLKDKEMYSEAIKEILDLRNLPILIHCNKGKHRVGTLCALLRIIQGWDKAAVRSEWDKFLGEGAPPGKNMIWSPGLFNLDHQSFENNQNLISDQLSIDPFDHNPVLPHHQELTDYSYHENLKKPKFKNKKVVDGLARLSEWEYVNEFPIESIQVDINWIPSWLPIESIERQ